MWIQCGMYLQSVSLLLSVMQMKNESYGSSSEVVTPKMQAFWIAPLQKNELSFEAFYVQPTVLNVKIN